MAQEDDIEHTFRLRSDYMVKVRLPSDLTMKDVGRLHRWLQTLPFDDRVTRGRFGPQAADDEDPASSPRIGHGIGDDLRVR